MCFRRGEAWEAAKAVALSLASDVETLPCRTCVFENPSGLEGNVSKVHLRQR